MLSLCSGLIRRSHGNPAPRSEIVAAYLHLKDKLSIKFGKTLKFCFSLVVFGVGVLVVPVVAVVVVKFSNQLSDLLRLVWRLDAHIQSKGSQ